MQKKDFSCYSFYEFYLLESIKFNLSQVDEARTFLPSYQYLEDKIVEFEKKFIPKFAEVLRDYLWYISLGEARHGGRACNGAILDLRDGKYGYDRGHVYSEIAEKFPPSRYNVDAVVSLFEDFYWRGLYGGSRWGDIARAVKHYEEWDNVTFIDHCADLQHNGGVAFNKSGVPFWNIDGYDRLMNFLNFKFHAGNLIQELPEVNSRIYSWKNVLSKDLMFILNKTYGMTNTFPLKWELLGHTHIPMNFTKYDYEPRSNYIYTDNDLSGITTLDTCYDCGDTIWDSDHANVVHGEIYCDDCMTTCNHCGEKIAGGDIIYKGGDATCKSCLDKMYTKCSHCHERVLTDTLDHLGQCEDCASARCDVCDTNAGELSSKKVYFVDEMPFTESASLDDHKKSVCEGCLRQFILNQYSVYIDIDGEYYLSKSDEVWDNPYGKDMWEASQKLVKKVTIYDLAPDMEQQRDILNSIKESEKWVA